MAQEGIPFADEMRSLSLSQMSLIPGAFFSDSDDEPYEDGLPGGLTPTSSDLIETDPDDEDFAPESDIAFTDGDDGDDDLEMADEDGAEDTADGDVAEPRGTLSIGVDREKQLSPPHLHLAH